MWNLLSNAIKFTPRAGKVQVVLERVNSHVEITVSDTGAGITSELVAHVFERFTQADSSTTRHFGGLGLGLAIAKGIVESHGGRIELLAPGRKPGAHRKDERAPAPTSYGGQGQRRDALTAAPCDR